MYEVADSKGNWLANAPLSSRKDARDAVVAARKAFPGWSGATAYNRGQILYRVAEMLEGRREQFTAEVAAAEGLSKGKAAARVDAAVDRWVWYAGWSDKVAQIAGAANPVAGPYFNLSTPGPTGVVAVLAPDTSSFLGLVSVIAPVIVTGNTAVVVASERAPLPALSLGEVLATSDLPGGVVNILSGRTAEIAAPLAAHQDVNAIDLAGADAALAKELETARPTTSSGCSVRRPGRTGPPTRARSGCWPSWRRRRSGTRWVSDPGGPCPVRARGPVPRRPRVSAPPGGPRWNRCSGSAGARRARTARTARAARAARARFRFPAPRHAR